MQREVLDYLFKQGGITLFSFPEKNVPSQALLEFAQAINAGACFVVVDFSSAIPSNVSITSRDLFREKLTENFYKENKEQENWIFGDLSGRQPLPSSDEEFRTFFHNIEQLKKKCSQITCILPSADPGLGEKNVMSIARSIVISPKDRPTGSDYLEDLPIEDTPVIWLCNEKPICKTHPRTYKLTKESVKDKIIKKKIDLESSPEAFAKYIALNHKIQILRKNPLEGIPRLYRIFFPLIFIVVATIPFIIPSSIETGISNIRDRIPERNKLSIAPFIEYTFDGNESMQRIGRYAIGRFSALVTNEKMVDQYVKTTLNENGFSEGSWKKDRFNIPPAGTIIKFSRPDNLGHEAADSIGAAWKYWTSIVSDSIAYITEFYYTKQTQKTRLHNGIDLASRQGARILAPFTAKAWTGFDERGGVIIGLVREKDVVIFMHCDQLLYLDGQEVMQGDPIATVGVTGHTTGPHAHIVTGVISKNGSKRIGNVRYNVIDPISWFYRFKPTLPTN
ncbi:MAG: M23 family metallopeptidase [Fibrobacteraceae bacterium]|nr:M23 family metallopeptidase [Fibrobacteraceae bacterium]